MELPPKPHRVETPNDVPVELLTEIRERLWPIHLGQANHVEAECINVAQQTVFGHVVQESDIVMSYHAADDWDGYFRPRRRKGHRFDQGRVLVAGQVVSKKDVGFVSNL